MRATNKRFWGNFADPLTPLISSDTNGLLRLRTLVRLEPMAPERKKGDPKAALCRCKLITHLKGALELEAQTRSGRVTNAVAPDIDTQVAAVQPVIADIRASYSIMSAGTSVCGQCGS